MPAIEWTTSTPAATWPGHVTFTPSLPLPRALGQEAIAEAEVAARTWSEVGCTGLRATVVAPAALVAGDDGVNGIFFHEDAWPAFLDPGALGQTVLHVDGSGRLHDADIHLNGVDYAWSLGIDPGDGKIDLRGVLLHEMGHALGLGHSDDPRATMNASHPPGLVWRSLAKDDEAGVCALYPGTGAARCDTGDACPAGFSCVARACERRGQRGEVCSPCARVPGACDGAGDDARCDDLPGSTGRVCGRACTTDADCGPRFRCTAQTVAGDAQCAPTDGCASGPDPCGSDADCAPDGVCRGGACVGPGDAAAGSSVDGGAPEGSVQDAPTAGGGCGVEGGASRPTRPTWTVVLLAVLAGLRRRQRNGV
jgi:hypothetical protein